MTVHWYQRIGGAPTSNLFALFDSYIPTEALTTITSLSAVSSTGWCPKCGTTKKSSKSSCCARGGAWFKKCGDASDTRFNHTWAEGIHACKSVTSSISVGSPQQAMRRHVGVTVNNTESCNATKQQANVYRSDSMSNSGSTKPEDYCGLAKAAVVICVLSIISHFQT